MTSLNSNQPSDFNKLNPQWQKAIKLHEELGFKILPPIPQGEKHPKQRFKRYLWADDIADASQITKWGLDNPHCKTGIACGKVSGIVVLEADDEEAKKYIKDHCPPSQVVQISASNKRSEHHVYRYKLPDGWEKIPSKNIITIKGKQYKLDVKADGGLIVAPGSYRVDTGMSYDEVEPWIKERLEATPFFDPAWIDYQAPDRRNVANVAPAFPDIAFTVKQELAKEWMLKQVGAEQGRGADSYAFALAVKLLWYFDLSPDEAFPIMKQWGELPSNVDEFGRYLSWTDGEIEHKLEDAHGQQPNGEDRPKGCMLGNEIARLTQRLETQLKIKTKTTITELEPGLPTGEQPTQQGTDSVYDEVFANGNKLHQLALAEKWDYIIDPLLIQGGINMISGQSFGGKTVHLGWTLGKVLNGNRYLNYSTKPCEVIYINGDANRIRLIERYLLAGLEEPLTPPNYHYLLQTPESLTPDLLELYCKIVWDKRGSDRPILIVPDTLRSLLFMDAKKGDDLDTIAMTQLMKPYKALTVKYKGLLTLWWVYHHARTTNDFYGSGAFMNLLDSYWNYDRDPNGESAVAKLKIQTREKRIAFDVRYNDGQFVTESKWGIERICEEIIKKAHDLKVSQTSCEKAFRAEATREGVRVAFGHLSDNNVLTKSANQMSCLADDYSERYSAMKAKLNWSGKECAAL